MKKVLLPVFGGLLLAGSSALVTGQNVDTAVKVEKSKEVKNQELVNSLSELKTQSNFSVVEIKALQATAQNWDNQRIDEVLNQALRFADGKLTFDYQQLNVSKLPMILAQNLKIVLANLNNAVTFGMVKVELNGQNVKLVYADSTVSSADPEIVYFKGDPSLNVFSSYMWYTTYGPSRWWKFWEWGGYMHFGESAVQVARIINPIASLLNIAFLFKNINELSKTVNKLSAAWNKGSVMEVDTALKGLAKILGQGVLDRLGDVVNILTIFTSIVTFLLALSGAGPFAIIIAIIELLASILASVTGRMIDADRGKGVKWQWPNFIIPGGMYSE